MSVVDSFPHFLAFVCLSAKIQYSLSSLGFPLRIQSYTFNTLFAIISGHHDLGHLSKSVGDKSDGTTISNNDEELGLEAGGTPNKSHVKANPVLK